MLITARSKALLGARPDAATSAHGGAQDIGLFAAPPGAFGASLSMSPATYAIVRQDEGDSGAEKAILAPQPFAPPMTPVSLATGDHSLAGAASGAVLSQPANGLAVAEPHVIETISTPFMAIPVGSSGGSIPHAGLPDGQASLQTAAISPTPSGPSASRVETAAQVAPLVAAVESSAANLQAAVTALLGQLGPGEQTGSLTQTISEQGAALSEKLDALTDDILSGVSETTAQTVNDLGDLAPAVTQALGEVPTLVGNIAPDTVASIDTAIDQGISTVGDVVSDTSDILDTTVDPIVDVANPVTNIVGDVAGSISATTEIIEQAAEPATQLVQQTVLPAADAVVEQVAQQASTVATDVTEGVADTTGTLLETAGDMAAPLVDSAQNVTAQALAPAIGQSTDMLGDLAGADPLGGVTTLTSLVSAADILETHDEAPQASGLFALQGATDTLDGLIAGDIGDDGGGGLLGIVPKDDGLLDGLTDHDGHGGLGLGLG